LLFSALFDYGNGILIERLNNKAKAKLVVVFSIIVNLGLLIAFKYSGFIYDNISLLIDLPFARPEVTLPIGISFYTFQTISYTIDVYRGDVKAQRNPMNFLLFVSLYHQLVAGPIVRYKTIADEINGRKFHWDDFSSGIGRFSLGLFKKIVIANTAGALVDSYLIDNFDLLTSPTAWFGLTMFAVQIYFDFSGYSDMAIGLGSLGFTMMRILKILMPQIQ
jgi:alginate O-acetyltransferase complex protein AlgI